MRSTLIFRDNIGIVWRKMYSFSEQCQFAGETANVEALGFIEIRYVPFRSAYHGQLGILGDLINSH